jgi:hypothetical protein
VLLSCKRICFCRPLMIIKKGMIMQVQNSPGSIHKKGAAHELTVRNFRPSCATASCRKMAKARSSSSKQNGPPFCHPSSRGTSTRRPPGTRYARRLLTPTFYCFCSSCDLACLRFARTNYWTRCTGSARCWGYSAACSRGPSPSSASSGSRCESPPPKLLLVF